MTDTPVPWPDLDALADAVARRLMAQRPGPDGAPLPSWPSLPGYPDWPPGRVEPDLTRRARLAIDGVELTQVTQHFRSRHGEDNTVPLVALKPMVVRAYPAVRPGVFGGDPLSGQRVTGELVLGQWGREVWRTGPTRSDGARLGVAEHVWRDLWDREVTGHVGGGGGPGGAPGAVTPALRAYARNPPLNFRVPAWVLRPGRMTATVRLWTDSGHSAVHSEDFTLLDVRAPKVAVVAVDWVDAAGNVSAPSDADMLATMAMATRMLPFPYFESTILGVRERRAGAFAMTVASGACNASWNGLLTSLALTRIFTALFQLADIVFGFVPTAAIPPGGGSINSGCGRGDGGVGGCFVGFESTFAHEIGHIYAREHVAVPGDPDNDTGYPKYGGDTRSIGEVGFDLGTSPVTVYTPQDADDIMSYGDNLWISPYTYRALLDARFDHLSAAADPRRVRPLLVLAFRVARRVGGGKQLQVRAAHRIDAAGSLAPRRAVGPGRTVTIDLVDANQRIVATHHALATRTQAGGCGCASSGVAPGREPWLDFEEAIDWPADEAVARLVFHDGDDAHPIGELALGDSAPPTVELEGPTPVDAGLHVVIRAWPDEGMRSALLLFSHDDGITWVPAAVDPPLGEPFVLDAQRLRGGTACRLRAVVTAGLQAGQRDSEPFEMATSRRALHLRMTTLPCEPHSVQLTALIDARGLGGVEPHEVRWRSDRDGDLGSGHQLTVTLSPGRHLVSATIPDGLGDTLAERGIIVVGGRPQR